MSNNALRYEEQLTLPRATIAASCFTEVVKDTASVVLSAITFIGWSIGKQ